MKMLLNGTLLLLLHFVVKSEAQVRFLINKLIIYNKV